MQQAISKDMATLVIGANLNFVNGKKFNRKITGHRFDGANPVFSIERNDFFFAGDQRNTSGADTGANGIIDFAGKKPERQADHAGFVGQHTLDSQMGFAGVGWP